MAKKVESKESEEIKNALERSGFKKIRMIQERDDMDSLVEAFK